MPRFLALSVCVLLASAVRADDSFFFKQGDRIVFLGDSITEQYEYSSFIELYLTTRFPDWNLTFLNAGISGDTAQGGAGRFKAHILDEKPTAVTINFGMNDGGYGAFDKNRNNGYVEKTNQMLETAKKEGIRVALFSPNAVDPRVRDPLKVYLETQKQFYAPLKELAQKNGTAFVDQYAVTRTILEKLIADEAKDVKPFPDGVHTSSSGGLLMAHTILTGLKAPALVSEATIDAAKSEAKTARCKVTNLKVSDKEVTFERSDDALPLPIQKEWITLLPYLSNLNDLNVYSLKVTGLPGAKYALTIDGKDVGTIPGKELASGVNLGNLMVGPIYEQSQKVFGAIKSKNQVVHQRFKDVLRANLNIPDWAADLRATVGPQLEERKQKELKTRREKIDQLQAEVYKLAQPETRRFKLVVAE